MLIKLGKQAGMSRIVNGISFSDIEDCIKNGVKNEEGGDVVSSYGGLKINFNIQNNVYMVKRLIKKWYVHFVKGML